MLVVDVWTLGVPSASRLSAGRPLSGSVIATSDAHVCAAYPRSVDRSEGLRPLPAAAADPADARARTTARSGAARRADIGQPRAGGGSERVGQPLRPVVATPSVIHRCISTNTISTGTTSTTDPAMSIP